MAQTPLAENQGTIYRGYDIVRKGSDYLIYEGKLYVARRDTFDQAQAYIDAVKATQAKARQS